VRCGGGVVVVKKQRCENWGWVEGFQGVGKGRLNSKGKVIPVGLNKGWE